MKIVAPAGDMDKFLAAVKAGADEIYMGLKNFGARRSAKNFTMDEFKYALDYAHKRGVKIFLTLNTVMKNHEIEAIYSKLKELYEYGLDAVIVQDLGLFKFIKDNFKDIELHGSTQLTITNLHEINFFHELGFQRIVLPRELTFEEIKNIRENTKIELEVFVSGALCISYSGNCYLSSFIGGRSGNRGMCAQPCRKIYNVENEHKYFLSPKDQLLGFDEISKLKEIGVESIKIEGRMKDEKYVYNTVKYYRSLIDEIEEEEKTSKIFNRGYGRGYFYGEDSNIINKDYSYHLGELLGTVVKNEIKIEEDIKLGDGFVYVSKEYEKLGGSNLSKITKKNSKENFKDAKKGEIIILNDLPPGTKYIYKNFSKALNDETEKSIQDSDKKTAIDVKVVAKIGEKLLVSCRGLNTKDEVIEAFAEGSIVQKAAKKPITKDVIIEKISELGDYSFVINNIEIEIDKEIDKEIFIPLSELKSIKRNCVDEFQEHLIESYRRKSDEKLSLEIEKDTVREPIISVIVSNERQKEIVQKYGITKIYRRGFDIAKEGNLKGHELESDLVSNFYQLLKSKRDNLTLYWNMNILNSYALQMYGKIDKLETVILSPEMKYKEIETLGKSSLKKGLLVYSKLKGMYIDIEIFDEDKKTIVNDKGDSMIAIKNSLGNTEIYLEKPLNILNRLKELKKLYLDELIIELTFEEEEDIEKIFKQIDTRKGPYNSYNYERGVY